MYLGRVKCNNVHIYILYTCNYRFIFGKYKSMNVTF